MTQMKSSSDAAELTFAGQKARQQAAAGESALQSSFGFTSVPTDTYLYSDPVSFGKTGEFVVVALNTRVSETLRPQVMNTLKSAAASGRMHFVEGSEIMKPEKLSARLGEFKRRKQIARDNQAAGEEIQRLEKALARIEALHSKAEAKAGVQPA